MVFSRSGIFSFWRFFFSTRDSRRTAHWVFGSDALGFCLMLAFTTCVGTPVPVPMPINAKMVRLSATAAGKVVVAGSPQATEYGNEVRVENLRTQQSYLAAISSSGSFALLIEGEMADRIQIRSRLDEKESEPLELSVPSDNQKPSPVLQSGTVDKDGRVTLTGNTREKAIVIATLLRTGEVAVSETQDNGDFQLALSAQGGERVLVFVDYGAAGISRYFEITVPDNKQNPTVCLDNDNDGFGDSGTNLSSCNGSTSIPDCNDAEGNAHPGQTQFFTQAITAASSGQKFDYNCDAQEEKQYPAIMNCAQTKGCTGEGWENAVPECGQPGSWVQCVVDSQSGCVAQSLGTRTQSCR